MIHLPYIIIKEKEVYDMVKSKIMVAVVVAAVIAVVICFGLFLLNEKTEQTAMLSEHTESESEVIELSFEDIGELATEEYYMTIVQETENAKQIFGLNWAKNKLIYSYDVTVKAGINFEEIKAETDMVGKTITLIVPEAEILDVTLDNNSFKVYLEKNNAVNPIRAEDVNTSQINVKESAEQTAVERGILEKAAENAEMLLLNFVRNTSNLKDYTVVIK